MHALRRFIEQQMEDNGWTPTDLVRQSGLSKQHLWKMLNDDRDTLPRLPSEQTLLGLAQGLRVPLNTVVLRAAQACGVPVDVTEVEVVSPRGLTTDQLLAEVRRRIEGEASDGTATNRAGGAGANVRTIGSPKPPTMQEIESGQAAAHRTRRKGPNSGSTGDRQT